MRRLSARSSRWNARPAPSAAIGSLGPTTLLQIAASEFSGVGEAHECCASGKSEVEQDDAPDARLPLLVLTPTSPHPRPEPVYAPSSILDPPA